MNENKKRTKRDSEEWKKGFMAGSAAVRREESIALAIGNAIIGALDNRYQTREVDY